jgi:hypothetical protein
MSRISFQKRDKERKRKEKQQIKAQKRADRKLAKTETAPPPPEENSDSGGLAEEANPMERP